MKRESDLKAAFGRELARQLPNFVVLAYATAGAPDRSIVGNGVQTNWEMKHAEPGCSLPGRQCLIAMRMAEQGHCRYVIWHEARLGSRTLIVHPREAHDGAGSFRFEASCEGFNHRWLVEQVRKAHIL
jgi:hypothetical protein